MKTINDIIKKDKHFISIYNHFKKITNYKSNSYTNGMSFFYYSKEYNTYKKDYLRNLKINKLKQNINED